MAEEESFEDLSEVYEALRKDAKPLITDLADSIDSRSQSANLMLYGVFFIAAVTAGLFVSKIVDFTTFLEFEAVGLLLLVYALLEKWNCSKLRKKYRAIFSAAQN